MFPYTVLARRQVEDAHGAGDDNTIAVLFANVLMTNRSSQELLAIIREQEPDVVLAVETDAWWQRELDVLAQTHRYAVRQPQDNTYGMLVYSRLELVEPEVKFLVQADVPSIHARVKLRSGALVELRCVHPRPPAPQEAKDAAPRDAELIVVGRELKEKRKRAPAIVLGDLNVAEPKALIGFAGPRVIEQTIRQKLPDGFQRSEFLLERGMLDLVVDRRDLKASIARALRFMRATPAPSPEPAPALAGVGREST